MKKGDLIDPDCIPYLIHEDLRNPQALQNLMGIAAVRSLEPAWR